MLRIAVDFDGTVVENNYPAIGKPMLFAFETMRELQNRGFVLILWTVRVGKSLDEAVEFCRKNGIEFYAVNRNHPEEVMDNEISRKLLVDIFIDDRNIGGFVGWDKVWEMLCPNIPDHVLEKRMLNQYKKKNFLTKLFFNK